ncbi:hypothetical protein P43SY_002011 [Pythium insidiosum]|uniref:Phosphodiesterase n=1 Tax=Pythium insidiosum TaxID=114742 RepID=A0AAD5LI70_PYTIN|nr:hypothetical protein P43SY_002011 [Pythium insidiosum]
MSLSLRQRYPRHPGTSVVPVKKTQFSLSFPSLKAPLGGTTGSFRRNRIDKKDKAEDGDSNGNGSDGDGAPVRGARKSSRPLIDDDDDGDSDGERRLLKQLSYAQRTSPTASHLRGRKAHTKQQLRAAAADATTTSAPAQELRRTSRSTATGTASGQKKRLSVSDPSGTVGTFSAVTPAPGSMSSATAGAAAGGTNGSGAAAVGTNRISGVGLAGGDNGLNQDRVNQRISRIYPLTDSVYVAKTKKTPVEVKFHPVTSHFVNEARLERLYQVTFARENSQRSSRIAALFFVFYMAFTGSNIGNLFSSDPKVREESMKYCVLVFTPIAPIPFLLYMSRVRKYEIHFQRIYTVVLLCWAFSIIAGGTYSMFVEWKNYVTKDINILMATLGLTNETAVYYVNNTIEGWKFQAFAGTRMGVLKQYTDEVLLPAATMNINLVRLIMVFVFVPLLRIDTVHFAIVGFITSFAYNGLTLYFYPSTDSSPFIQNHVLVLCFPLLFAFVMLLRNRDVDRVIRQDFLHVWAVELEAEKATREKNLIAEENRNLKRELAQRDSDFTLDLTSPLHSILAEFKSFLDDTDMSDASSKRGHTILRNLSKLDTNLFVPDIRAQMKSQEEVDNDTKNWALSVLARKDYQGTGRMTATMSLSSHSNSDTRRSYQDNLGVGMGAAGGAVAIAPLPNMPAWEDEIMSRVKSRINQDGWDLDTLKIAELTNGRPLMYVTAAMFDIHELHEEFRIDKVVLRNFLFLLDDGYLANPYHNSSHAADVVNSVNFLMTRLNDGQIRDTLTNLEFYAALVAAAIHDFRHPGKSNNYMIKCKHDLAIQYNDRSILESMHLAETFFIMRSPQCDIFGRMKDKPYREIRKAIIEMVLSTDLSMHLQLVGNLKALIIQEQSAATAGNATAGADAGSRLVTDPMMVMKVVIKCADIGHAAKERRLHVIWSSLIIEEFFLQGDNERANNTDISPFMDRTSENSAKNQVGFFEFIVLPFYDTVAQVVFDKEFAVIHNIAKSNYGLWKESDRRQLTSIIAIKNEIFLNDKVLVPVP